MTTTNQPAAPSAPVSPLPARAFGIVLKVLGTSMHRWSCGAATKPSFWSADAWRFASYDEAVKTGDMLYGHRERIDGRWYVAELPAVAGSTIPHAAVSA